MQLYTYEEWVTKKRNWFFCKGIKVGGERKKKDRTVLEERYMMTKRDFVSILKLNYGE